MEAARTVGVLLFTDLQVVSLQFFWQDPKEGHTTGWQRWSELTKATRCCGEQPANIPKGWRGCGGGGVGSILMRNVSIGEVKASGAAGAPTLRGNRWE